MKQIISLLKYTAMLTLFLSVLAFTQPTDWTNTGGPFKGRPLSVASDQDGRLFVATVTGIYRSTDEGTTWSALPSDIWIEHLSSFYNKSSIHTVPNGFLFMRTDDSLVYRSTDQGDSWSSLQSQLSNVQIKSLVSSTAGDLFALVDSLTILRSSDNGDNWTQMSFNVSFNHIYSFAVDSTRMMLIQTDTCIYVSTDNGSNWLYRTSGGGQYAISSNGTIFASYAENAQTQVWCGTVAAVSRSTDFGSTWNPSLIVCDGMDGWVIANYGKLNVSPLGDVYLPAHDKVYRSTDNGSSWVSVFWNTKNLEDKSTAIIYDANGSAYIGTNYFGLLKIASRDTVCNYFAPSFKTLSINEIAINNSGNVFASADSGVYRSMDNGVSWMNILAPHVSYASASPARINSKGMLFSPKGEYLFRSTDNGDYWDSLDTYGNVFGISSSDMIFQKSSYESFVYRSTDDGNNWTQVSSLDTAGNHITSIYFAFNSQNQVFAAGYRDFYIYRSLDSGNSWFRFHEGLPWRAQDGYNYHGLNGAVYNLAVHPSGIIFAASDSGFYRSTNNAESWQPVHQGLPFSFLGYTSSGSGPVPIYGLPQITSIAFNSEGNVFVGYDQGVYYSTDLGDTWIPFITDPIKNYSMKSIAFDPLGYLYGGSFNGTVYRSTISTTSAPGQPNTNPQKWTLEQNYPNPFNPATNITFAIPKQSMVSLKIYDLLGREVSTLVSEQLPAGSYIRQWNAEKYASGVYFYRLQSRQTSGGQTDSFIETKKLLLLK